MVLASDRPCRWEMRFILSSLAPSTVWLDWFTLHFSIELFSSAASFLTRSQQHPWSVCKNRGTNQYRMNIEIGTETPNKNIIWIQIMSHCMGLDVFISSFLCWYSVTLCLDSGCGEGEQCKDNMDHDSMQPTLLFSHVRWWSTAMV